MRWEMVRLREVCEIVGGTTPDTNKIEYWNGNNIWLSPIDLPEIGAISKVNNSYRKITDLGVKESGLKILPIGSLVFSSRASIGKIGIVEKPLYTNQGFTNFIPNGKLNVKFLAYALKVNLQKIEKLGNSTTFKEVSRSALKDFQIPLPPLPVQQKIAAILDKADALRRADAALLKQYEALGQAIFMEMFGSNNSTQFLKGRDVLKVLGGAAFKSTDYCDDGIPLIRIGTINKGYFDKNQLVYLPSGFEAAYSKYIVKPNDLLITLTGTIGKDDYGNIFRLSNNYSKAFLNQ